MVSFLQDIVRIGLGMGSDIAVPLCRVLGASYRRRRLAAGPSVPVWPGLLIGTGGGVEATCTGQPVVSVSVEYRRQRRHMERSID